MSRPGVVSGHKKAATHFDTFENLHVVVAGTKKFFLVSPQWARHMYVDYPPSDCAEQFGEASGAQGFGCDSLGCYGYVPFDDYAIDSTEYPLVKDVTLHVATLEACALSLSY